MTRRLPSLALALALGVLALCPLFAGGSSGEAWASAATTSPVWCAVPALGAVALAVSRRRPRTGAAVALGGLALWCLQAWRYRSAEVFAGGPVWVFGPYDEHPSPGVTAQVADSASGPGTGLRLSTDLLDHWPVGPDVYPTGGWGSAHLSVWAWVLGAVLLVALVKVAARR